MRKTTSYLCVTLVMLLTNVATAAEFHTMSFPGFVQVVVNHLPTTDVLFVVDGSGSMSQHQDNLAKHIPVLGEQIQKTVADAHVGVIRAGERHDSGLEEGALLGTPIYFTGKEPNFLVDFAQRMLVGTNGAWEESIFRPVIRALTEPLLSTVNSGFYRENAHLSLVFLTDAEDQSKTTAQEFYDFLMNLKNNQENWFSVFGFFIPSNEATPDCRRDNSAVEPAKLEKFMNLVKGETFHLCDPNLAANVDLIAKSLFPVHPNGVDRVPLPNTPVFSSISVDYGTQKIHPGHSTLGWTYDAATNEIVLGSDIVWSNQAAGTRLIVTYTPEDWQ